ncbi:MAG: adenine phosphoribosyltransferase [Candidatus Omnitrophica bacterium]|nr:adenine phosphoribosyltransferase [Candidatus Omnitrophota bacterium]
MKTNSLKKYIREIPDFPKPGILFKDITTLLGNSRAFKSSINLLAGKFRNKKVDAVVAAEARGFIIGAAVAEKLNAAFIPVRKKGKLPWKTHSATYALEYGVDSLHIHMDAIKPGSRVLILDDLLATGGTVKAMVDLVKKLRGKVVGIGFLIELTALAGRKKIKGYTVHSLIKY